MINLSPLMSAPPVIQLHAAMATLALVLGPFALLRRRRDLRHKVLGYAWITAMALTALSSFGIHAMPLIGPFGPIHALSVLTLGSLAYGLRAAIRGNLSAHRKTMQALYLGGLAAAGVFTLWPGRIMNRVLFADHPFLAFPVIALLAFGVLLMLARTRFKKGGRGSAFPLHIALRTR